MLRELVVFEKDSSAREPVILEKDSSALGTSGTWER